MKALYKNQIFESLDLENPIKGGLGDDYIPNKAGIVKGLIIEKEHVGDLNQIANLSNALDIVSDHLAESPDYYDHLEKMEHDLENENK